MAAVTPDLNQIAIVMSELQHNYTQLAQNWFDIFYNPTPKDVTITFFNEIGNLDSYVIPNRAKDFTNILNGEGTPEETVIANKGAIYQDLTNGEVYLKRTGSSNIGWIKIVTETDINNIVRKGDGEPEGNVTGSKGDLYVNRATGSLYVKSTDGGNTGWIPAISTDYATHSEVQQAIEAVADVKADKALTNLTTEAEKHFLNKTQVSNCILEAPNDVCTVSGNNITIKQGLKLLIPNGRNQDLTLNNIEYTFPEDLALSNSVSTATKDAKFFLVWNLRNVFTLSAFAPHNVYYQDTEPLSPGSGVVAMWFSTRDNYWHYTSEGSPWNNVTAVPILTADIANGGSLSNIVLEKALTIAKMSDVYNLIKPTSVLHLSGTSVSLTDNSAHSLVVTGSTTISLPTVYNNNEFHQMLLLLSMSTPYAIDLGTSKYFNGVAPYMSSAGNYTVIYEYDGLNWYVGALYKGN